MSQHVTTLLSPDTTLHYTTLQYEYEGVELNDIDAVEPVGMVDGLVVLPLGLPDGQPVVICGDPRT